MGSERIGVWRYVAVLSVAGAGCAPLTAMPPPVPFCEGTDSSVGAVYSQTFPVAGQDQGSADYSGVDAWFSRAYRDRVTIGSRFSISNSGSNPSLAAGLGVRLKLNDGKRALTGLDVSGGMFWFRLGVPLSFAVTDRLWLYTQPSLQASVRSTSLLPVGLSMQLGERLRLHAELGHHAMLLPSYPSERSVYAAAGASMDWGSR